MNEGKLFLINPHINLWKIPRVRLRFSLRAVSLAVGPSTYHPRMSPSSRPFATFVRASVRSAQCGRISMWRAGKVPVGNGVPRGMAQAGQAGLDEAVGRASEGLLANVAAA